MKHVLLATSIACTQTPTIIDFASLPKSTQPEATAIQVDTTKKQFEPSTPTHIDSNQSTQPAMTSPKSPLGKFILVGFDPLKLYVAWVDKGSGYEPICQMSCESWVPTHTPIHVKITPEDTSSVHKIQDDLAASNFTLEPGQEITAHLRYEKEKGMLAASLLLTPISGFGLACLTYLDGGGGSHIDFKTRYIFGSVLSVATSIFYYQRTIHPRLTLDQPQLMATPLVTPAGQVGAAISRQF